MLEQITVFVLTFNEEVNLVRVLPKLGAFRRVIVLDSFSTDQTLKIVAAFPNVELHQRKFDQFAAQCNHVLDQLQIRTPWVMSLDADYVLSDELCDELATLKPSADLVGYDARFVFCIDGTALPGSLYPNRTVLFRSGKARYYQTGHTQRLAIDGPVGTLKSPIFHDDRKSWSYFLGNQKRYGAHEAQYLFDHPWSALKLTAKLRKIGLIAPWLVPLICLLPRRLLFAGKPGLKYTQMRWVGEIEIAKALWRLRWQRLTATAKKTS